MRRNQRLRKKDDFILGLTLGGFSSVLLIGVIAIPIIFTHLIGYREQSITEGKIKVVQDFREKGSRYRLFISHPITGDPVQEYEIRDSYWRGVWNSGTTLNKAMANEGKVCHVYGVGRRVQRMSWYPVPTDMICNPQ
jgi:hypothetical protein